MVSVIIGCGPCSGCGAVLSNQSTDITWPLVRSRTTTVHRKAAPKLSTSGHDTRLTVHGWLFFGFPRHQGRLVVGTVDEIHSARRYWTATTTGLEWEKPVISIMLSISGKRTTRPFSAPSVPLGRGSGCGAWLVHPHSGAQQHTKQETGLMTLLIKHG